MSSYRNDAGEPTMTASQARFEADLDSESAMEWGMDDRDDSPEYEADVYEDTFRGYQIAYSWHEDRWNVSIEIMTACPATNVEYWCSFEPKEVHRALCEDSCADFIYEKGAYVYEEITDWIHSKGIDRLIESRKRWELEDQRAQNAASVREALQAITDLISDSIERGKEPDPTYLLELKTEARQAMLIANDFNKSLPSGNA